MLVTLPSTPYSCRPLDTEGSTTNVTDEKSTVQTTLVRNHIKGTIYNKKQM